MPWNRHTMVAHRNKLNELQLAFVQEYLIDFNATKAAIRAGYSIKGAAVAGYRLRRNVNIDALITKELKKRGEFYEVTTRDVAKELSRIAFAQVTQVAEWTPDSGLVVRPSDDLDDDARATIKEIEDETKTTSRGLGALRVETQTRKLRVKQHDKVRALELLARHLGMFQNEQGDDPGDGKPIALNYKK